VDSEVIGLPDVNLLLALLVADHQHHDAAMQWWDLGQSFATAAVTENGFIRLTMNPKVMGGEPLNGKQALAKLASLRARKRWTYWTDATSLVNSAAANRSLLGARQVTDLHLLSLAIAHRGVVLTFDAPMLAGLNKTERKYVRVLPTSNEPR